MAITSVRCPVLRAHVSQVTNLEDEVTAIICAEYEQPTGVCRLKKTALAGGPLSQLIERLSEDSLRTRTTQCDLGPVRPG